MIVDSLGEELKQGDLVIFHDYWPAGKKVYVGKISHIVPSGRLAIMHKTGKGFSRVNTYRNPNQVIKYYGRN